jgi:hypothetical protein
MEKKYCCDKFKGLATGRKDYGLNIRIVKLSQSFVERGQLTFDRSFMITEGYSGGINECKKVLAIEYCPFCGTRLNKFYKSDDYVQEVVSL